MTKEEKLIMREKAIEFINRNTEFWSSDMVNYVIESTGFKKEYMKNDYKVLIGYLIKQSVIKVLTYRKGKKSPERMYYREHMIYIEK